MCLSISRSVLLSHFLFLSLFPLLLPSFPFFLPLINPPACSAGSPFKVNLNSHQCPHLLLHHITPLLSETSIITSAPCFQLCLPVVYSQPQTQSVILKLKSDDVTPLFITLLFPDYLSDKLCLHNYQLRKEKEWRTPAFVVVRKSQDVFLVWGLPISWACVVLLTKCLPAPMTTKCSIFHLSLVSSLGPTIWLVGH